jgi:hypothetical protein
VSISRFDAKPPASMANPASASAARTPPATVQVASVASGAATRASSRTTWGDQMPGFFAGEKPSRKNASTLATSCGSIAEASPRSSVRITLPPSK